MAHRQHATSRKAQTLFTALLAVTWLAAGPTGVRSAHASQHVLRDWSAGAIANPQSDRYSTERIQEMLIMEALANENVPPALALAVARIESNFQADAESSAGARGVMQIMPATARSEFDVDAAHLWDPVINIRLGVEFLSTLFEQYNWRWDAALSHYNGGSLDGPDGAPHSYTQDYVARVLAAWKNYAKDPQIQATIAVLKAPANAADVHMAVAKTPANAPRFTKSASNAPQDAPAQDAQGDKLNASVPSKHSATGLAKYKRADLAHSSASQKLFDDVKDLRARVRTSLSLFSAN